MTEPTRQALFILILAVLLGGCSKLKREQAVQAEGNEGNFTAPRAAQPTSQLKNADDYRKWKNRAGKTVEGKIVGFGRNSIIIRSRKTGKEYSVFFDSLCDKDQEFARLERRKTAQKKLSEDGVDSPSIQSFGDAYNKSDCKRLTYLLWLGIGHRCRFDDGMTPLCQSAIDGKKDIVLALLKGGADIEFRDTRLKATPLIWAANATTCSFEIAQILIKYGAAVNVATPEGTTALGFACVNGNLPLVRLLLKAGADPNARDSRGDTYLAITIKNSKLAIAKALITSGADVNSKSSNGVTAAMVSAYSGHLDFLKFLVANGADLSATDISGGDIIGYAKASESVNSKAILAYLRSRGIRSNSPDYPKWRTIRGKIFRAKLVHMKGQYFIFENEYGQEGRYSFSRLDKTSRIRASKEYIQYYSDQFVKDKVKSGELIDAQSRGVVVELLSGGEARGIVGYRFTFRTRGGLTRTYNRGHCYWFFGKDPQTGRLSWHCTDIDLDGLPRY